MMVLANTKKLTTKLKKIKKETIKKKIKTPDLDTIEKFLRFGTKDKSNSKDSESR